MVFRETDAEYRDLIDFIIKSTINRYNHRIKNLYRISGSTEERIKLIQQAISL
jgi:hypothetical protein